MLLKKLLIILITTVFVNMKQVVSQVQWPFPNGNQQGEVTGSIGEFRQSSGSSNLRFHKGVDLTNGAELSVHAVNEGTIIYHNGGGTWDAWTSYVRVGDVFYYHIKPKASIISNTDTHADVGEYLGEMIEQANIGSHLHLQENNTNYLNNNLSPYVDDSAPFFSTATLDGGVKLYRNGINKNSTNYASLEFTDDVIVDGQTYTKIYGKIDIAAHVIDFRTNSDGSGGGGQIVPHTQSWSILSSSGTEYGSSLSFDAVPNNNAALSVFHPLSQSPGSPSVHILTSSPLDPVNQRYDRFFNTRLRIGQTETWDLANRWNLDARYTGEAHFVDGIFSLDINANDVDYNDSPNLTALENSIDVVIDNFKPYVEYVDVHNDDLYFGYTSIWAWDTGSNTISQVPDASQELLYTGENLTVTVETSEQMQSMTISIPTMGIQNEQMVNVFPTTPVNKARRAWDFDISATDNTATGYHQIILKGKDMAGNDLLELSEDRAYTVPMRDPDSNGDDDWLNFASSEAGDGDANHTFWIEGGCSNPGGRIAGCLIASFRPIKDANDPFTYTFIDTSTPTEDITSWSWDFGDSNTSSSQNPTHTFSVAGIYIVALTITNNEGVDDTAFAKVIVTDVSEIDVWLTYAQTSGTLDVVFTGHTSDNGSINSWNWNISPANYSFVSGSGATRTARFTSSGTYNVSLEVVDNTGASYYSPLSTVTVESVGSAIVPDFTWAGDTYTTQDITLIDNSTYTCYGVGEASYEIRGPLPQTTLVRTGTFIEPSDYTFSVITPGEYKVSLRLTCDGDGPPAVEKSMIISDYESGVIADFGTDRREILRNQSVLFVDSSRPHEDIGSWAWILEGGEGTSITAYSSADRYFDRSNYEDRVVHKYTREGVFEAGILISEVGSSSLADWKQVQITVHDNVMTEYSIKDIEYRKIKFALSGDYIAVIDNVSSPDLIEVIKRSGVNWSKVATLALNSNQNINAITMNDDVIVARSNNVLHVFEKQGIEWTDMSSIEVSIPNNKLSYYSSDFQNDIAISPNGEIACMAVANTAGIDYTWVYIFNRDVNGDWIHDYSLPVTDSEYDFYDLAMDNNAMVVSGDVNGSNSNVLHVFEKSNGSWSQTTTISRGDKSFAESIDVDNGTIVTMDAYNTGNNMVNVYQKPWSYNMSPTGRLVFESNSFNTNGYRKKVSISGDKVVAKVNNQIVMFEKPIQGWGDIYETVRIRRSSNNPWDEIQTYPQISGSNIVIHDADNNQLYFYGSESSFCDDLEVLDGITVGSGESLSNSKGIVQLGGSQLTVQNGGAARINGTSVTLKPGFHAQSGSDVTITGTTCANF